jgi:hypothetical protein
MRQVAYRLLAAVLALTIAFGFTEGSARGQGPEGPVTVNRETQEENIREVSAPSQELAVRPAITFIDSPSVTCYKPDPAQDGCYLNWYYMSVSASPNYMIAMTVTVNAVGVVARVGGFFQTSMYVPHNMLGDGFKVPCGAPGAGGNPSLGNAYAWTINARDSSNLKSANYGTAYCPAQQP